MILNYSSREMARFVSRLYSKNINKGMSPAFFRADLAPISVAIRTGLPLDQAYLLFRSGTADGTRFDYLTQEPSDAQTSAGIRHVLYGGVNEDRIPPLSEALSTTTALMTLSPASHQSLCKGDPWLAAMEIALQTAPAGDEYIVEVVTPMGDSDWVMKFYGCVHTPRSPRDPYLHFAMSKGQTVLEDILRTYPSTWIPVVATELEKQIARLEELTHANAVPGSVMYSAALLLIGNFRTGRAMHSIHHAPGGYVSTSTLALAADILRVLPMEVEQPRDRQVELALMNACTALMNCVR